MTALNSSRAGEGRRGQKKVRERYPQRQNSAVRKKRKKRSTSSSFLTFCILDAEKVNAKKKLANANVHQSVLQEAKTMVKELR